MDSIRNRAIFSYRRPLRQSLRLPLLHCIPKSGSKSSW